MNRIELVEKIAATHNVSKAEAGRILETVTGAIVAAVTPASEKRSTILTGCHHSSTPAP